VYYSCCSRDPQCLQRFSPSVASEVLVAWALVCTTQAYFAVRLVCFSLSPRTDWLQKLARLRDAEMACAVKLSVPLTAAAVTRCMRTYMAEALPQINKQTSGRDGVIGIAQGGMSGATVVQQIGLHDTRRCTLCRCMSTAQHGAAVTWLPTADRPLQEAKEALRRQTAVRYASSGYAFVTFSEQVIARHSAS
jgi:hypothetical protein